MRLSSGIQILVSISMTAGCTTNPITDIVVHHNQTWNFITPHGICSPPNTNDDSALVCETLDYFSVYTTLKQYTCQDTDSVLLSFCCSMRHTIEDVLLGQGFGLHREIRSSGRAADQNPEVCCVKFKRFSNTETVTTSLMQFVNSSTSLTIAGPPDLSLLLYDVTKLTGWETACILYSEEYLSKTNVLTRGLSKNGIKFWLHTLIGTETDLISTMTTCYYSMRNSGINFVLLANQATLENILLKMNSFTRYDGVLVKVGLMSRWLVLSEDICVTCLEPKIGNVSNISILKRKVHAGLEMLSEMNSTDVVTYEVMTSYWQKAGRQFGTVVTWSTQQPITVYDDIFPNVKNGLNNATLILTTKEWSPFTIKQKIDGKIHFKGICMDIMDEMSFRLNFSYIIVEPPDDQWGLKASSGNWTGMIAQLANREVDVMIGAISIQQEREEVMDFIHPFYNDYTTLLVKKPDKALEKWKILIAPLEWTIVVCVTCALPLITLLVATVEKFHLYYSGIDRSRLRGLHRFDDCLWYNLAALLNEGGQHSPKDQASRTLVASWWLFTMVIVASYTSTLTAALAVEKTELPFNTIEEMVEQSQYKWGGTYGSYMFMLFPKSENEIYKKLWNGIQRFWKENPNLLNKSHAVQVNRVRAGGYVYLNDKSKNLIEIAQDCTLAMGKQEFLPLNFGIGLQQDSPYKELFDHHMITVVESGLLELWKSKWWPEMNNCTSSGPASVKAISVADVQGGYLVLGIGIGSALITFILENLIKRTAARCKCPTCKS
ncbi:glutamate receptor U1-like [Liolophura sinensis]|uniref:glutamate receptor U1-like n=1 Tax=Liolophura sinensis TaxID=3198878 RepID=UPI003158890D